MDLEFTISAQEAATSLQVEIADNRATVTGLASGRKIVFEGVFGDVTVKLLPAQEQAVPTVLPEVTAEQTVTLEPAAATPAAPQAKAEQADPQLFGQLVALRKKISSEVKMPPFIIFHDSTLKDMCRKLPVDLEAMGTVSGVGEAKLAKFGDRFLAVIREYLKTSGEEG
jgi:ATP-dependent DNA helicase RecQ